MDIPEFITELGLTARSEHALHKSGIKTVLQLITKTEPELLSIPNMGETSIKDIQNCLLQSGLVLADHQLSNTLYSYIFPDKSIEALTVKGADRLHEQSMQHEKFETSFKKIAAWGIAHQIDSFSDACRLFFQRKTYTGPLKEIFTDLETYTCSSIAGEIPDFFDWRIRIQNILNDNTHYKTIMEGRAFGESKTLEEIGSKCNLTRERIRQLEAQFLNICFDDPILFQKSKELFHQIGSFFPKNQLSLLGITTNTKNDVTELEVRILLTLIPRHTKNYELENIFAQTYSEVIFNRTTYLTLQKDLIKNILRNCFFRIAQSNICHIDQLTEEIKQTLSTLTFPTDEESVFSVKADLTHDIASTFTTDDSQSLVKNSNQFLLRDNYVLRWDGDQGDKAVSLLQAAAIPLSGGYLSSIINPATPRGAMNSIQADPRIHRITKDTYALVAWGQTVYKDVVSHIIEEIENSPQKEIDLVQLQQRLFNAFSISPASVMIHATTNPLFLESKGIVKLRPSEVAIHTKPLDETRGIFRLRRKEQNTWAWSFTINEDWLRGSGAPMPQSFGIHLGCNFGEKGSFFINNRQTPWGWTQSNPAIGSLRELILESSGNVGDRAFLYATEKNICDLEIQKRTNLNSVAEQIRWHFNNQHLQNLVDIFAFSLGFDTTPTLDVLWQKLKIRNRNNREKTEIELFISLFPEYENK